MALSSVVVIFFFFFFSSRRRHTRLVSDWSSDVCSSDLWKNWGAAGDGLDFQRIEKACPAFAAEYAAVMLRVSGGSSGHYGPLRTRAAEVRPECDSMLQQIQSAVNGDSSVCSSL